MSTINAAMAAGVIRKLAPKAVIPMHYKTPTLKRELGPVEDFLKEMGMGQVESRPRLSLSRSNLVLSA